MNYLEIARQTFYRNEADGTYVKNIIPFFNKDKEGKLPEPGEKTNYPWIVSLHGLAKLAQTSGSQQDLQLAIDELKPFINGEVTSFHGALDNYKCGGNATAFMLSQGMLPEAKEVVKREADKLCYDTPRSKEGIYGRKTEGEEHMIWIDVAFAVCPFLTFAGVALDEPKYIDEAFNQIKQMYKVFYDAETGLLHQARGFNGPDTVSEDCWSRGNGWGIYGLAEIIAYMPDNHKLKEEAEELFKTYIDKCIEYQDNFGMWHQEMTRPDSYTETSGSCLIAYGIGLGLEKGVLPASYKEYFDRAVEGMSRYIALDGSIFNSCVGCLSPGAGTKEDYMAQEWMLDDSHAFGPVILLMVQAERLKNL